MNKRFSALKRLLFLAGAVSLGIMIPASGCNDQYYRGKEIDVIMKNDCMDPFHYTTEWGKDKLEVGYQVQVKTFIECQVPDEVQTYTITFTREDITLGVLTISTKQPAADHGRAVITMSEPSYFHLTATVTEGGEFITASYEDKVQSQ
ncbi:hypothetical protein GX441_07730 [bacterium]|nr:hypothetical protein [bacterium]